MKLSSDIADKVWTILVEECGVPEREREIFIFLIGMDDITEYRFCGNLGFGGKFWPNKFEVNCYQEDENEERRTAMEKANGRLVALKEGE
jgi:hypothetical protein